MGPSMPPRALPLAFMMAWSCLTISCCAMPAPTLSSSAPATTKTRFIRQIPFGLHVSARQPRTPSVFCQHRMPGFIPGLRQNVGLEIMPLLGFADRDPDPLGGRRHVDVGGLVFAPQALGDGVHDRRTGADRA